MSVGRRAARRPTQNPGSDELRQSFGRSRQVGKVAVQGSRGAMGSLSPRFTAGAAQVVGGAGGAVVGGVVVGGVVVMVGGAMNVHVPHPSDEKPKSPALIVTTCWPPVEKSLAMMSANSPPKPDSRSQ